MDYPTYLAKGWPIASRVIEGASRHLVREACLRRKDRLELSGMHWTQDGAENLLHLRAVAENDDWDAYHAFRKYKRRLRLYNSPSPNQTVLERQVLDSETWRTSLITTSVKPSNPASCYILPLVA
ncbi:MAG: hypothetical protein U9Q78_02365 [Chloroflexota bacterium]|nr:hypothetical protein [Chloroflexota bacterium]